MRIYVKYFFYFSKKCIKVHMLRVPKSLITTFLKNVKGPKHLLPESPTTVFALVSIQFQLGTIVYELMTIIKFFAYRWFDLIQTNIQKNKTFIFFIFC
jgi:hypothetical protein